MKVVSYIFSKLTPPCYCRTDSSVGCCPYSIRKVLAVKDSVGSAIAHIPQHTQAVRISARSVRGRRIREALVKRRLALGVGADGRQGLDGDVIDGAESGGCA